MKLLTRSSGVNFKDFHEPPTLNVTLDNSLTKKSDATSSTQIPKPEEIRYSLRLFPFQSQAVSDQTGLSPETVDSLFQNYGITPSEIIRDSKCGPN